MQADPGIPEAAASETSRDALVRQLREQISDADCALIEALNTQSSWRG